MYKTQFTVFVVSYFGHHVVALYSQLIHEIVFIFLSIMLLFVCLTPGPVALLL